MKEPQTDPTRLQQYRQLAKTLGRASWISEGYVQDRGPGWRSLLPMDPQGQRQDRQRGFVARTVQWLKKAIENWRALQATIKQMQLLSRQELFGTIEDLQDANVSPKMFRH